MATRENDIPRNDARLAIHESVVWLYAEAVYLVFHYIDDIDRSLCPGNEVLHVAAHLLVIRPDSDQVSAPVVVTDIGLVFDFCNILPKLLPINLEVAWLVPKRNEKLINVRSDNLRDSLPDKIPFLLQRNYHFILVLLFEIF